MISGIQGLAMNPKVSGKKLESPELLAALVGKLAPQLEQLSFL